MTTDNVFNALCMLSQKVTDVGINDDLEFPFMDAKNSGFRVQIMILDFFMESQNSNDVWRKDQKNVLTTRIAKLLIRTGYMVKFEW